WLIEYALRVRPRSSEKNPWLLSPPSTVLLLRSPEMPRKLIRPKLPSGVALGVRIAKLDQRRPFTGSSLIEVWLRLVEKSCCVVLITGASALTSTVPVTGPTESATSRFVSRPISTTTFSVVIGLKPDELTEI